MDPSRKTPHGTERAFGWLFAAVFTLLGTYLFLSRHAALTVAASFAAAAAFAFLAVLAPRLLRPLDRAWHWLGHTLGRIVGPIVLGFIYFGLITPLAVVARLFGRDELRLKPRDQASYWIARTPPGPSADSIRHPY